MKKEKLRVILKSQGQKYSEALNIDVSRGENEIFKWFLASLLFGAPISETLAIRTYRCFEKYGLLTPEKMLKAGWDSLVAILDEGGYTRYDYKTADKIMTVMKNLVAAYSGRLESIHFQASDPSDLEEKLKGLGKGIGDVTVNVFLRELRGVWAKARPRPTGLEILAAEELGILKRGVSAEEARQILEAFWKENHVSGYSFINFETALLRIGKKLRKKRERKDHSSN